MADDDPDDQSPWTRDDWDADSAVPDAGMFAGPPTTPAAPARFGVFGEPPADDFDDRHASVASRSSLWRKVIAAAIVAALLLGSAGALLGNAGSPDGAPDTSTPADRTPTVTLPDEPSDTLAPTAGSTITVPSSAGTSGAVEIAEPIPAVVVGEPPGWAERTIVVPENLAEMAPTEVITLTQAGVVNVTEFPSGRTRSLDVSDLGAQAQLAVGDRTIVVFNSVTLLTIRDGEPVVESSLSDGIIFVQPWSGTGSFVVTTPSIGTDSPERDSVLRPDGRLEPLVSPLVNETSFFSRVFSPAGDALVTAPGGVYAISPDGTSRRISTGNLMATGKRHWAVEECDERLRCAYSIVEWDTGTVTAGALERIDTFGFLDPSTHISPDGRSVAFRADTDGSGRREILDVVTGATIAAGRINQLVFPDAWATDSSGVFITDRVLQFVDRETGVITPIEDLDRIRTVATSAFAL